MLKAKRPFYYDVVEGKPITFTTESTRFRVQSKILILLIFLKSGGQLWVLDDYWFQFNIPAGHSAVTADFNWSPLDVSVIVKRFDVVLRRG